MPAHDQPGTSVYPTSPVHVPAQHEPVRGWTKRWVRAAGFTDAGTLVQRVLAARGLSEPDRAGAFLEPKLAQLLDPGLIPDIDRAARRLLDAARAREPIVIYGDYDVDGITATTILYHTLKALAPACVLSTYVPHRLDEGYGLNADALAVLAGEGAKVIVSVDCGVTAIEPARRARQLGVDLIITDHHNPPATMDELPEAYAIVHPRRPDSAYPFEHLCGAGVAYKLAWRLCTMEFGSDRAAPHMRALLVDLLAFAALGSIADVVPLVGENRVIASFGLGRIRASANTGLRALVSAARLDGENVTAWDVGFKLGPRLNASGRMSHAREAVELFTTADQPRAEQIAGELESRNQQRRAVEQKILESAIMEAERAGMTRDDRRAIVLAHPDWHKGVVGIVCSRLVEKFCRPAILLQIEDGGVCHGSGRSIDGYNLHAGLHACREHLTKFGGHDMAAGLGVTFDNLPAFVRAFTDHANAHITPDRLVHDLRIDAQATLGELSTVGVGQLDRLAPFGRGNPSVHLLLEDLRLHAAPQPMGKGGEHLALLCTQGDRTVRIVAWRWGEHRPRLAPGVRLHAVVRPAISTYGGRVSVEPELLDLATAADGSR